MARARFPESSGDQGPARARRRRNPPALTLDSREIGDAVHGIAEAHQQVQPSLAFRRIRVVDSHMIEEGEEGAICRGKTIDEFLNTGKLQHFGPILRRRNQVPGSSSTLERLYVCISLLPHNGVYEAADVILKRHDVKWMHGKPYAVAQ